MTIMEIQEGTWAGGLPRAGQSPGGVGWGLWEQTVLGETGHQSATPWGMVPMHPDTERRPCPPRLGCVVRANCGLGIARTVRPRAHKVISV